MVLLLSLTERFSPPDNSHTVMDFDTKELRLLDALFTTNSLAQAASKLGISPSQGSRWLQSLRERFNDPLFERYGQYMYPTTAAKNLRGAIERALTAVDALTEQDAFDPKLLRRAFVIGGIDNGLVSFLGPMLQKLRIVAPHVSIIWRPLEADFFRALRARELDLVIYASDETFPGFGKQAICSDIFVYVCHKDHRFALQKRAGSLPKESDVLAELDIRTTLPKMSSADSGIAPSADALATTTSFFDPLQDDTCMIEGALGEHTQLWVPYFAAAGFLVSLEGGVGLIPFQTAKRLSAVLPIEILGTPRSAIPFQPFLIWDKTRETDVALEWLRAVIVSGLQAELAPIEVESLA